MAQSASNTSSTSTREAAIARRRAMANGGKAALAKKGAGTTSNNASPRTSVSPVRPASVNVAGAGESPARAASRARREAMSNGGKAAIESRDRNRAGGAGTSGSTVKAGAGESSERGCGCGCKKEGDRRGRQDATGKARPSGAPALSADGGSPVAQRPARPVVRKAAVAANNASRNVSMARRQALASRGKAGVNSNGLTAAQTARAGNLDLSSRDLARALRVQRSQRGAAGQKKSEPCGRQRPNKCETGAASDQPWKVGASETGHGQTVTGTQVGRSRSVTGDEPSTCRDVTGTEYLGADIFREFCQSEPAVNPRKVGLSPTSHGNRVTGNEVGRSRQVTGDEPGTCKRVTGTEYLGANQAEAFCGTKVEAGPAKFTRSQTAKGKAVSGNNVGRSSKVTGDETGANRDLTGTSIMQPGNGKAPAKVGSSTTLRGGRVSGTTVGRSASVTGDEPGSCRNITGDDYVGQEHYNGFCGNAPKPQDAKVGASQTFKGRMVSGTMTGRSGRVTGDEPGTCKAVTGTPYAGAEQYRSYCQPEEANLATARTRIQRSTPGSVMTGQQPGLGSNMTGAEKGACENISGTPYIGADQFAAACPATAAEPNSPDFPQPLGETPWGQFSVVAPGHASQVLAADGGVTGSRYEQGRITGPFGMASGKVTGTEEARFGRGALATSMQQDPVPPTAETDGGRVQSRITGEGMDVGPRITGDDWDRGDRVTGTEGTPATGRNPTRRGPNMMSATRMAYPTKRNGDIAEPVSPVTGGSGYTHNGALVTYSGGARG